jgi:hypothetical protein
MFFLFYENRIQISDDLEILASNKTNSFFSEECHKILHLATTFTFQMCCVFFYLKCRKLKFTVGQIWF